MVFITSGSDMQDVAGRCHQDIATAFVGDLDDHIAALINTLTRLAKTLQLKAAWMFPAFLCNNHCSIMQSLVTLRPVFKVELSKEQTG